MPARLRPARREDIPAMQDLERACYPHLSEVNSWKPHHLESHQRHFPEGQILAVVDDVVVGHCANFITRSEQVFRPHTFRDITRRGTFDTHDPQGDTLYGAEIMVHPDHRRRGVGKKFYKARFAIVRERALRYFAAGGRLPQYGKVAHEMTAEAYVKAVLEGRRNDRVLSAQTGSGLQVRGVLPDYLNDPSSRNWATLLVWENPDLAQQDPRPLPWVSPSGGDSSTVAEGSPATRAGHG